MLGSMKYHVEKNHLFYLNSLRIIGFDANSIKRLLSHLIYKAVSIFSEYLEGVSKGINDENNFLFRSCQMTSGFCERDQLFVEESEDNSESEDDESYEDSENTDDEQETDKKIKIDSGFIEIIEKNKLKQYFDMEFFDEDTLEYSYYSLNSLENCLKKFKINLEVCYKIINAMVVLYQKGIEFSVFPSRRIMVSRQNSEISSFTFGLNVNDIVKLTKKYKKSQVADYKADMVEKFSKLLLNSLSENHFTKFNDEDVFKQNFFEEKVILKGELEIGKGGFGCIYKNKLNEFDVAIKVPKCSKEDLHNAKERIFREINTMKKVNHKYIIKVYGIINYENCSCLVLEYCPNESLKQLNKPHVEKLVIMKKVAMGLNLLHKKKITHYDLKPQNVLLTNDFCPKIIDFGLAMSTKARRKTGFTIGYADPQQFYYENPGSSADIWGFSITLYSVVVDSRPYAGVFNKETKKKEFFKMVYEEFLRPQFKIEFSKSYPYEEELIRSCWIKDTEKRPGVEYIIRKLDEIIKLRNNS